VLVDVKHYLYALSQEKVSLSSIYFNILSTPIETKTTLAAGRRIMYHYDGCNCGVVQTKSKNTWIVSHIPPPTGRQFTSRISVNEGKLLQLTHLRTANQYWPEQVAYNLSEDFE
jgi:hypothetical protein